MNACPGSLAPTSVNRGSQFRRMMDRYGGIPLVAFLGLIRRRRQLPDVPSKIALLNTAAIGDTVLMSGPISDLRDRYSRARLILLAGPSNYEAGGLLKNIERVVKLDVFNPMRAVAVVRKEQPDLLIDFGPWPRVNALIAACSNALCTIGFKTRGEHRHFAYDIAVEHSPHLHELANFRQLARAAGADAYHAPSLGHTPRKHTTGCPSFVVFHLWPGGAGSSHKEWPLNRWKELGEIFLGDGYEVVLSGSKGQFGANEQFIASFASLDRKNIKNIAGISLDDLTSKLLGADLVVSVNTGVMHIADALGVPLVSLSGPTNARRWGPVSSTSISLESPLSGCGYLNLGFEFPRNPPDCMKAITLDTVIAACRSQLRGRMAERRQFV